MHSSPARRGRVKARVRAVTLALGAGATCLTIAACGSSSSASNASSSSPAASTSSVNWATATSAAAGGGEKALIAAAKQEGQLNVIALPPTWANYETQIKTFEEKYGIKVNSANPEGSSQEEIDAVKQLGTQSRAPDVLDIGQAFATPNTALFAPYEVSTWSSIPSANKASNGEWVNDYGGYISFGCNMKVVKSCPGSFKEMLSPQYKNDIALNGNPETAGAAFSGLWAAALANGGSYANIKPGIEFFEELAKSGNFVKTEASPATIQSGQTPIVIDWDYLNAAQAKEAEGKYPFEVKIPSDASFAAYYAQAINKNAPHPAAARLWEEFLYSNEGQNIWLEGLARPIRLEAMTKEGTADKEAAEKLPPAKAVTSYPTVEQESAAKQLVGEMWAKAV